MYKIISQENFFHPENFGVLSILSLVFSIYVYLKSEAFIELLLVFVINIVVPMVMQGNLQANMRSGMALLGLIFCVWFLEMLGVTIGRICDGVMINTGVAMGGMVLAIFFLIAALNYPAIILVVAVALAVPMMIFGINFVLKRVRESYYDERVKVRV